MTLHEQAPAESFMLAAVDLGLTFALLLVSFVVILGGAELFTNGIEWLGHRLNLSQGMVGSVLAAVGTALPETMIPIIAILFTRTAAAEEVGIGAILGAPFMLSTAAMFVTGVAIIVYARRGRRANHLNVDQVVLRRDLGYFLAFYIVAAGLGLPLLGDKPEALRIGAGIALIAAYVLYVRQTASGPRSTHEDVEGLNPLHVQRRSDAPRTWAIVAQVVAALGLIVIGAHLFVHQIEVVATAFSVPALVLSLVIAPLATELPEKFNSVLWIRQRKDTLAMGNISGAMVFQSCIPVAIGIMFTPWVLNEYAIASAVVAIVAGLAMQIYLRTGRAMTGRDLATLGVLYVGFIIYIVAVPHSAIPAVH